jgi:hypothetical protein
MSLEQDSLDLPDYDVDEPRTFASSEEQHAFLHFESNLRMQARARNDIFLQEAAIFQVIVSPPFASVAGYDIDHMESDDNETTKTDHCCLSRSKRVTYDRGSVMAWIQRDYLMVVVLMLMTKEWKTNRRTMMSTGRKMEVKMKMQ